jgi:hypothetical protein
MAHRQETSSPSVFGVVDPGDPASIPILSYPPNVFHRKRETPDGIRTATPYEYADPSPTRWRKRARREERTCPLPHLRLHAIPTCGHGTYLPAETGSPVGANLCPTTRIDLHGGTQVLFRCHCPRGGISNRVFLGRFEFGWLVPPSPYLIVFLDGTQQGGSPTSVLDNPLLDLACLSGRHGPPVSGRVTLAPSVRFASPRGPFTSPPPGGREDGGEQMFQGSRPSSVGPRDPGALKRTTLCQSAAHFS